MSRPAVSILLTCYNHRPYLDACLSGVWAQTFTDFEVLALDDGSTDGTRERLAEETDPRFRALFNEENLGTYGTLNRGLREAKGDFIAVLNDDDVWQPTKLARQMEMMRTHPRVGLVHTNGRFIDGEGEVMSGEPLGFSFPRTETGDILLALVYANKIIASSVLVRRECFMEVGSFNEDYFGSGDWEMWFRIAEKHHVGYLDEPLTDYRVHGSNASHKLEKIWADDERLRDWIRYRIPQHRARFRPDEFKRAEAHNLACLGTVRTLNGNPGLGREAYRASAVLNPARWQSWLRYATTFLPRNVF
ncbi:MAG: glycosyltransferase, partial [Fimbriimonadaceae bacterium]|nr:glycosyltransferase [Fimbriimonadaceae bacterium]